MTIKSLNQIRNERIALIEQQLRSADMLQRASKDALLRAYREAPQYTWAQEFGLRDTPPREILDLIDSGELIDVSWHNDVCPSFVHRDLPEQPHMDSDTGTRLWSHPEDADQREMPSVPRYNVCRGVEVLVATDDVALAIDCLRGAARTHAFPGWQPYSTGGGCTALFRDLGNDLEALLTAHDDAHEPTNPKERMHLGVYARVTGEACALFSCRDLAQAEDILGAIETLGDTAVTRARAFVASRAAEDQAAAANAPAQDNAPATDEDAEDRDPNDCAECGRSFGPNYTGRCTH